MSDEGICGRKVFEQVVVLDVINLNGLMVKACKEALLQRQS